MIDLVFGTPDNITPPTRRITRPHLMSPHLGSKNHKYFGETETFIWSYSACQGTILGRSYIVRVVTNLCFRLARLSRRAVHCSSISGPGLGDHERAKLLVGLLRLWLRGLGRVEGRVGQGRVGHGRVRQGRVWYRRVG